MSDDLHLLQRWRDGDRAAGEALVRDHYRPVFEYLRSEVHGNAEVAKDLTQQVFLVVVSNRNDIVAHFRDYLYSTARFKLWEHFRRRSRTANDPTPASSQLTDPGRGIFSVMVEKENGKLLVRALQSLSIEEQAYLMWHYADKLTYPEIAKQSGLATSQINGRVTRAKAKLRKKLEELLQSPAAQGSLDKGLDTWMMSLRRRVEKDEDDSE